MPRYSAIALLTGAALLGCPSASRAAPPAPDLQRIVFTEKDAVMVGPAQVIASGAVDQATWSTSGRFVLAARTGFKLPNGPAAPPAFQQSLILWDAESGKAADIWTTAPQTPQRTEFHWLAKTDVAFAVGRWSPPARAGAPAAPGRDWLLRVDAPRNSMKPLFALPPNTALLASPREPLAVLWGIDDGSVRVLKSDGTLLRQVAPPAGMTAVLPRWAADGRILAMGITRPSDDAQAPRPAPVNLALELSSGGFVRLDKPLPEPPAGPDLTLKELVLTGTQAVLQSGSVRQAVSPLWLVATAERAESRALVSANAQSGTLSPRGDAVLLISDGAALIAPLIRLPKEALLAARNQAMRQKVLSNGKQLGLALHVYASDHEDRFPDAGAGVEGLLLPYLKTDALFDGFVYTYTGGKISEIPEPSKVVLGYVMGPGGRAEIWGDGHVTWKDDQ